MLTLFKNHNIMMPVDFGDNPYTIKASPPPSPKDDTSQSSKWDWNKLFVPMQAAMNNPMEPVTEDKPKYSLSFVNNNTDIDDEFKYASPFAKKSHNNNNNTSSQLTLNPNAPAFNFLNPNADSFNTNTLNAEAPSFHMDKMSTDTSNPSNPSTQQKKLKNVNDDTILAMHGFKKIRKMEQSLQGAIYYGETIRGHDIAKQLKIPKNKKRRVVIKKTLKSLHNKRISKASKQDNTHLCVDENIVKEAIILHHLTVDNSCAGSSICKLLSFFESASAYYIVMEYCGNMTLKRFVDKAHQYIRKGKLKVSHWKKICKYVAWQIAATLYWMHTDMNCVHLDLTMQNIIINNGNFIIDEKDGTVTIDRSLSCKIIDFGLSEIFDSDSGKAKQYFEYNCDEAVLGLFHVNTKYGIAPNHICPEKFNEHVYDARKADTWALGVILFYMSFGMYPFQKQVTSDSGYWSLKHKKIDLFLDMNHLSHLYNNKLIELISGCLCLEETQRFNIGKLITNVWFKTYFKRYADKMQEQSQQQIVKNEKNKNKMDQNIPYYKPSTPTYI